MSSNYRTGTLNLVLSENRNSDYSTISNKWKNTLQLYNKLKKFELNFSILSTDPNISNLFYKFLLSKESKLSNSCLEKIVNLSKEARIDEDWSERKIEKYFNNLPEVLDIISKTKANQNVTINQTHSGIGNNEANIKF